MNKLKSTKNQVFISLVGPSETEKSQLPYNWLKIETFQPKFDKIYFFVNILNLFTMFCRKNRKSRFCAWSKLWIYWFVKKQRYKVLVNFLRFVWKHLQFKGLCWHCHGWGHRGLSTIYIKHNLFHQNKLEGDVELQNPHIVLFKSPRDVMRVTTLSTQLGLSSELVDWHRDATSVLFGRLFVDLSPRTDDRLRYSTNTGSFLSKFYIPDWLKQSKILDDETQNLSTLQVFQSFSHKCQVFSFSLAQNSLSGFFANA